MSPASRGGLKVGDVLITVNGVLVTLMTHPEIVEIIRAVEEESLSMTGEDLLLSSSEREACSGERGPRHPQLEGMFSNQHRAGA